MRRRRSQVARGQPGAGAERSAILMKKSKGRRKVGRKKRRMRAKIRHHK
jgi:hypothetical protein